MFEQRKIKTIITNCLSNMETYKEKAAYLEQTEDLLKGIGTYDDRVKMFFCIQWDRINNEFETKYSKERQLQTT